MRIQNNIMAMNTHRQYNINQAGISKSTEKLSSGYRINRAGDDAAGLAISEKMRAQIRGLTMASKNSQDAISLVQTAEGALQETHNILQRMRELAVQSASDTNEQTIDRGALQQEFQQLKDEIDEIASKTRFNDQNLIDGTFQKVKNIFNSADSTLINFTSMNVDRAAGGTYELTVKQVPGSPSDTEPGDAATASAFYTNVADAIDESNDIALPGVFASVEIESIQSDKFNNNVYQIQVDSITDETNVTIRIMDSSGKEVSNATIDLTALNKDANAENKITFDGFGTITITNDSTALTSSAEFTNLLGSALNGKYTKMSDDGKAPEYTPATQGYLELELAGETVKLYTGDTVANFKTNGIAFEFDAITDTMIGDTSVIDDIFGTATGIDIIVDQMSGQSMVIQTGANQGDELGINIDAMNTKKLGVAYSSIDSRTSASKAITEVNNAINQVSTQRAALGALQNRLDHKIANLDTSAENLTAAEARIRDVDMAKEMTNFTKNNILFQASTAMLAQANAAPQGVLQLLG